MSFTNDITKEQMEQWLDDLRASGIINENDRLDNLLQYLITEEWEGRGERIKAFSIAVDVFGRDEKFNPTKNSLVRVEMHRLRKALELFNDSPRNTSGYEMSFQFGSYRPKFKKITQKNSEQKGNSSQDIQRSGLWSFLKNNPRRSAVIICALAILLASLYFLFDTKNDGKICMRPGIYYDLSNVDADNRQATDILLKEVEVSFPLVNMLPAPEYCLGVPQYSLMLSTERHSGNDILHAQLFYFSPDDEKMMIWEEKRVTKLSDKEDTSINLASFIVQTMSYFGEIPNHAMNQHWNNAQDKRDYSCHISGYNETIELDELAIKEFMSCLKSQIDRNSPFADVYGNYLEMVHISKPVEDYDRDEHKSNSEYKKYAAILEKMDPDNMQYIRSELSRLHYVNPPNPGRMESMLTRAAEKHGYNPEMLLEIAKVEGFYNGDWDMAGLFMNRAERILPDSLNFSYAHVGYYIVNEQWDDLIYYMKPLHRSRYAIDGLYMLVAGNRGNDKDMMEIGVETLKLQGITTRDQAIIYVRKLPFHSSFIAIMIDEINRAFPA